MKVSCSIQLRDGIIQNPAAMYKAYIKLKSGTWKAEFTKLSKRSLQQNKYYWKCVVWVIRHRLEQLGNDFDAETVHNWLKEKFNSVPVIGEGGEYLGQVGMSTTEMNKEDFGIYIDKITAWANDFLQITIPEAGSQMEVEYE